MCTHQYIVTDYSQVCQFCGIETPLLSNCTIENCGFSSSHQRLVMGYSRVNRFRKILGQVLFPCITLADNEMLHFLSNIRNTLKTIDDLKLAMRKAPIKNKRFHSIHAYSRLFLNQTIYVDQGAADQVIGIISLEFREIEMRFMRIHKRKKAFINYKFLLHYLLDKYNLGMFKKFVPMMKCPKRTLKYELLMKQIYTEPRM